MNRIAHSHSLIRSFVFAFILVGFVGGSAKAQVHAAPPLPPPSPWRAPTPRVQVTAAGSRVVLIEEHTLPVVHLALVVPAGSALDPPDQPGLAAAVATMLEEGGAGSRGPSDFHDAIDDLGGELRLEVDPNGVRIELSVLSRHLERALALLGDLVARPHFERTEWPEVQKRRLAEILRARDEPYKVANQVFRHVLYGDHPYGHSQFGTAASVQALTVEDLRSFYRAHYGPRTATLVVVGDATLAGVANAFAKDLGGWSSTASWPTALPTPPHSGARVILVDRPGAPQSEVRVGHLGVARSTPDYPALSVLETILGGSFTSRLSQNLRERHGYTYGANARFWLWSAAGPFWAQAAVRTDVTAESIHEMVSELRGMMAPLSVAELDKGRSLVKSRIVEEFSDGSRAARLVSELVLHGLPLGSWGQLPAALDRLDVAGLAQAATRLFFPDELMVVVVGDRKLVEPKLRALGLTKSIDYCDLDGNPLK